MNVRKERREGRGRECGDGRILILSQNLLCLVKIECMIVSRLIFYSFFQLRLGGVIFDIDLLGSHLGSALGQIQNFGK